MVTFRVFEHGFASAGTTTCEAGVEVAPRVHFMADESGLKHSPARWGVDVALLVVSSAGETDLQQTGTRTCQAGADGAPSLHSRAGEDDLEHKLSEVVMKTCEASSRTRDYVS